MIQNLLYVVTKDFVYPLAELSHRILDSANGLFVFVVHVL